MTQFEFLAVIISIVIAFGISDILSSWGEQIRLRSSIRPYRLHLAWTVLLLLAMIDLFTRTRGQLFSRASAAQALIATVGILLAAIVLIGLVLLLVSLQ